MNKDKICIRTKTNYATTWETQVICNTPAKQSFLEITFFSPCIGLLQSSARITQNLRFQVCCFYSTLPLCNMTHDAHVYSISRICKTQDGQDFSSPVTALNSALTKAKTQETELVGWKQSLFSVPLSQLIMAIIEYPFIQSFKMCGR